MKNESAKKSLEKSKNVLEEKRKTVKRKICIKKDTDLYNNCYELRSRAINYYHSLQHHFLLNIQCKTTEDMNVKNTERFTIIMYKDSSIGSLSFTDIIKNCIINPKKLIKTQ